MVTQQRRKSRASNANETDTDDDDYLLRSDKNSTRVIGTTRRRRLNSTNSKKNINTKSTRKKIYESSRMSPHLHHLNNAWNNDTILYRNNATSNFRRHRKDKEPSLRNTVSDLLKIVYRRTKRLVVLLRPCMPTIMKKLLLALFVFVIIFASFMAVIVMRYVQTELRPLCSPPPSWEQEANSPPLIEYYVHGRGNGHYARSVAIIEKILDKGIDVRMFIGRATMWKAVNEAQDKKAKDNHINHAIQQVASNTTESKHPRGELTVKAVASIRPTMSLLDTISLMLERVITDCKVAKGTNRYPLLVVTDGEWPGLIRSKAGSIPSVSVAHGQMFVIGQEPKWIRNDNILYKAWKKQKWLNSFTSWGANWIIATNFVDIPIKDKFNGVISRSPMRPEVIQMGQERQERKKAVKRIDSDNVLGGESKVLTSQSSMDESQKMKINELLFGKDVMESLELIRRERGNKLHKRFNMDEMKLPRRKLVVCYFRDKNGDLVTNALLRSGFDVVLFERGFHKEESTKSNEKKFGQNLVYRQPTLHLESNNDKEDDHLMDHWMEVLAQTNRHLLGVAVDKNDILDATQRVKEMNSTSEQRVSEAHAKTTEKSITDVTNATAILLNLFTSDLPAPRKIRVSDMSLFVPLLSIADGVSSSAGSQLMSECIFSNLNILALHREDDSEQRLNIAFSKHRHGHLSNDSTKFSSSLSLDYYAKENVVHGMSLEKFAVIFKLISQHESDEYETILSETEESLLFRTLDSRQTYDDFKTFVHAVRKSPFSWSYYHDLFYGIVKGTEEEEDVGMSDETKKDKIRKQLKSQEQEDYIDPFQGMPDAALVILEIIDDLRKHP